MSQRVLSFLTVLYLVLQRYFLFFLFLLTQIRFLFLLSLADGWWLRNTFYSFFFFFYVRMTIFIPAFYTFSNIKLMRNFRFPAILFPLFSALKDLLLSILFLFLATFSSFIILHPHSPYTVPVILLLLISPPF